jgi:hypothetical protein
MCGKVGQLPMNVCEELTIMEITTSRVSQSGREPYEAPPKAAPL